MNKRDEYIGLLNGTSLTCHPKGEEDLEMGDSHFRHALSRYFIAGRWSGEDMVGNIPLRELFREDVYALYDIADRILSDSKLFFVPIPGAYHYGSGEPTTIIVLGMYSELWKSCPEATIVDEHGAKMFCYAWAPNLHFAGRDERSCVMRDSSSYLAISKKWEEIRSRYRDKVQKYQCHSLLQVLAMLENEGRLVISGKANIIYKMAAELSRLDLVNRQVVRDRARMKVLFHDHLIRERDQEVRLFLKRMKAEKAKVDAVVDAARDKKVALLFKLHEGELTSKQYRSIWNPINRKKNAAIASFNNFVGETLRTLFPGERVSLREIEGYIFKQEEKAENTTQF